MPADAERSGTGESHAKYQYYRYDPSLAGAIVSVAVFGLLTAIHVWKLVRFRTFYFISFTIGGACT